MQRPTFVLSLVVCIAAFIVTGSWASSSVTVYKFKGVTDGRLPTSSLVEDEAGNFYGTTAYGGFANNNCSLGTCGTVFRFSRKQSGGWSESVIYSFTGGPDGSFPQGKLALDGMGNLYGTAVYGGSGYGTVFELTPN